MAIHAAHSNITPKTGDTDWDTRLDQKRRTLIQVYAETQFENEKGVLGKQHPSDYMLAKILSQKSGTIPAPKLKTYQVQAGLWVLGLGKGLGKFGTGGFGIDGKMGKHTRQVVQDYMDRNGLRNFAEAEQTIIREAQFQFLMHARFDNFAKAEKKLRKAGYGDDALDSFRKINFSMMRYLESGIRSREGVDEVKADYRIMRKRFHHRVEKDIAKLAHQKDINRRNDLLQRAYSGFHHPDPKIRKEWKKTYFGTFSLLKDTVGESREVFCRVLKQYKKIAQKMRVDPKIINETMYYFAGKHFRFHKSAALR